MTFGGLCDEKNEKKRDFLRELYDALATRPIILGVNPGQWGLCLVERAVPVAIYILRYLLCYGSDYCYSVC